MDTIKEMLASQGLSRERLADVQHARSAQPSTNGVETVGVRGHLKILGIAPDRTWTVCDSDNIITNTGFLLLSTVWGGPTGGALYDNLRPNKIAIGTGFNASPTGAMTTLQMGAVPTFISNVSQIVFTGSPSTNGVRFELLVPNGISSDAYNGGGAGAALREAGLFANNYSGSATGAGGMISYRTYPTITKTELFSLLYMWSFNFATASV